jgi:probable phosphoglycerate mutase
LPLLTRHFAPGSLTAIHCSPRLRTRETAQALALRTGALLVVDPAFDEIDFGAWTGRTFAELDGDAAWTHWNTERSVACAPEGERMSDAQSRAMQALERLAGDHAGRDVAIVSHAELIRAVLLQCLGLPLEGYTRLEVSAASRSLIEWSDWGTKVIAMNERPS